EPLILDYTVNGNVAGPAGHDSDRACPHGVYQAAGIERYVAIAVETNEQWEALQKATGIDVGGEALNSFEKRRANKATIDAALREWCASRDAFEIAAQLKAAGVPASVVQRPLDLFSDPQLAHRNFFVTLDH